MTDSDISALIERHPAGLTSIDAARVSGEPLQNLSSRLSKLYAYGKIARITAKATTAGGVRSTWLPKQNGAAR